MMGDKESVVVVVVIAAIASVLVINALVVADLFLFAYRLGIL